LTVGHRAGVNLHRGIVRDDQVPNRVDRSFVIVATWWSSASTIEGSRIEVADADVAARVNQIEGSMFALVAALKSQSLGRRW
jgi:hypothetical protein